MSCSKVKAQGVLFVSSSFSFSLSFKDAMRSRSNAAALSAFKKYEKSLDMLLSEAVQALGREEVLVDDAAAKRDEDATERNEKVVLVVRSLSIDDAKRLGRKKIR